LFEKSPTTNHRILRKLSCAVSAWVFALAVVLDGSVHDVWACDSTVRGTAFEEPRDVHRLCVISDGWDTQSQALFSRLEKWLAESGANLNVELVRLDGRDENVQWPDYGIPSAPLDLPVVMLAGYDRANRRSFVITHWEPGPSDKDLDALTSSPAREAIKREVVKHWAVVLYATGAGGEAGGGEAVIEAVANDWVQKHAPGLSVVRLDRTDPRERLLASFIGLPRSGPDWVGIVFGRGKLMAPPLEGREITEEALEKLLSQLIEICSCLRPPTMMGVDIPMLWEPALDESVVSLLPPAGAGVAAGAIAPETPSLRPAGHAMLAATLSALGLSALVVFGATLALVRRERRRRAIPHPNSTEKLQQGARRAGIGDP